MKIGLMVIINELQETYGTHQTIFLCGNPSVHCIQTSKAKVKGSVLSGAVGFFSEYSMPTVKDKCLISFIYQGKSLPSHLPLLLIFHNHFYRRMEAQEELHKAKLTISLFSSSLSVLTEGVAGDVLSHRGALPGSPNRVVSSRPQATCTPEWQP